MVDRDGLARTDDLDELGPHSRKALGDAARELERALLVVGVSVHTPTGAHAKRLETWETWARRVGFALEERQVPEDGQRTLEEALDALNARFGARGRLPWQAR